MPASRLGGQVTEVVASLESINAPFALIRGLALASHNVVRATQDVDLLVAAEDADRIEAALLALTYRCMYRSQDAANYARGDERVDLLYAHRPIARKLLGAAVARTSALGTLRVVSVEGLIGLKLTRMDQRPASHTRQGRHSRVAARQPCYHKYGGSAGVLSSFRSQRAAR